MHLHHLKIANFRCLRYLEIEFTPGLNVLVGENNIGKTAVLDAIRAALGAAANESLWLSADDRHRDESGKYSTDAVSIELVFSDLSETEQSQFIDILSFDALAPEKSTAQINFRWLWNEKTQRYNMSRWGGATTVTEHAVPEDVLQTIPVTLLGALRDATTALMPGRGSRLASLLRDYADDAGKNALVKIIQDANNELERVGLINAAQTQISTNLGKASGPLFAQRAQIKTSEPDFDRITQSLRLVTSRVGPDGIPIFGELRSNGLGFNNLLYIATVMSELDASKGAILPLLLVEEPEAHLHPQLQTLLSDFLDASDEESEEKKPEKVQTIITTHSPTIASHVSPESLRVLHLGADKKLHCASFSKYGFTGPELNQLRRMLDVTRASLLFAKAVILVEGITEALLLPVLAKRNGINLDHEGISVVPVCGVDFATIGRLFGKVGLHIPLAIITDGDSGAAEDNEGEEDDEAEEPSWRTAFPKMNGDELAVTQRVQTLYATYKDNPFVKVFHSDVTLEYALAAAGTKNPTLMCSVWCDLFIGTPRTLNKKRLNACNGDHALEILAIWRGIGVADSKGSKAAFAQALAATLDEKKGKEYAIKATDFATPQYLLNAFKHVTSKLAEEAN